MSRAWGEHDIEEKTRVFFLSFLRISLVFSRAGAVFEAHQRAAKVGMHTLFLAQGSSHGSCGKREVYPAGQGHPHIPGPPAAGLTQAGGSSHPGTTMLQASPEAVVPPLP